MRRQKGSNEGFKYHVEALSCDESRQGQTRFIYVDSKNKCASGGLIKIRHSGRRRGVVTFGRQSAILIMARILSTNLCVRLRRAISFFPLKERISERLG